MYLDLAMCSLILPYSSLIWFCALTIVRPLHPGAGPAGLYGSHVHGQPAAQPQQHARPAAGGGRQLKD